MLSEKADILPLYYADKLLYHKKTGIKEFLRKNYIKYA